MVFARRFLLLHQTKNTNPLVEWGATRLVDCKGPARPWSRRLNHGALRRLSESSAWCLRLLVRLGRGESGWRG